MVWDLWCFEDLEKKDDLLNQSISEIMMRLIVEQPRLHWVCKLFYDQNHYNKTFFKTRAFQAYIITNMILVHEKRIIIVKIG